MCIFANRLELRRVTQHAKKDIELQSFVGDVLPRNNVYCAQHNAKRKYADAEFKLYAPRSRRKNKLNIVTKNQHKLRVMGSEIQ